TLIENSINGDMNSKKILNGLLTFETSLNSFNKILIDSIEINNDNYYTILLENQNPVYNLFAIVDKNLNLILKDESLNGYLNLNFKKSGSRRFAIISEEFKSKDVIDLKRISYYSMEQYSSGLVFRQFTIIRTPEKEFEQTISAISDSAIYTSITSSAPRFKPLNDIFRYDVSLNKYESDKNLFDSLVYREVRTKKIQTKNPQIVDAESILNFFNNNKSGNKNNSVIINEKDFEIKLDSSWKKLGFITISNLVKQKLKGLKYISGKLGAGISIAEIAPTDSAENYFNESLSNKDNYSSKVRYSNKLVDNKNIYQLFEFSCASKKIIMIMETPKSTYESNKNQYEQIIQSFLLKC
ncbi:MAG TPA: hypothetical protein VF270_08350, partial [Ignavibacteriaceae bacterium]